MFNRILCKSKCLHLLVGLSKWKCCFTVVFRFIFYSFPEITLKVNWFRGLKIFFLVRLILFSVICKFWKLWECLDFWVIIFFYVEIWGCFAKELSLLVWSNVKWLYMISNPLFLPLQMLTMRTFSHSHF